MNKIAIAIHGGAGTILKSKMTTEKEIEISAALDKALTAGYEVLKNGGTSIDAVERAVIVMEDSHLFNAGKGSVFTSMGTHEMDASIMDGKTLNAGSVALVSCVKNPISLAKMVMLKSEHVFLAGKGAEDFAKENGCQLEDNSYFYDEYR
jgi:beta-aspartyl-peptidase (threonine type)